MYFIVREFTKNKLFTDLTCICLMVFKVFCKKCKIFAAINTFCSVFILCITNLVVENDIAFYYGLTHYYAY